MRVINGYGNEQGLLWREMLTGTKHRKETLETMGTENTLQNKSHWKQNTEEITTASNTEDWNK